MYKCTRATRARTPTLGSPQISRGSHPRRNGTALLSAGSKRVAGPTHFGKRNSSRFDLAVLRARSIDNNSDLVDRWCTDIVNTFCYDFVADVTRADCRADIGSSLVPLLFLDVMLDLRVVFSQLMMTWRA